MRETHPVRATLIPAILALCLTAAGCEAEGDDDTILLGDADTTAAITYWSDDEPELTAEDIELGRMDSSWRRAASIDSFNRAWAESAGVGLDTLDTIDLPELNGSDDRSRSADPAGRDTASATARNDRTAAGTGSASVDTTDSRSSGSSGTASRSGSGGSATIPDSLDIDLPVQGGAGADVRTVQTMLDLAGMSPGIIDGKWGKNTEKAVYWLQRREGLPPTSRVDQATWRRIVDLAGSVDQPLVTVALTEEDVSGPFVDIPQGWEAKAEMDCLCYSSLSEKLAERFHSSPELLSELNPEVDLDAVAAGDSLRVPAVRSEDDGGSGGAVAKIVVSAQGHYLHLVDEDGEVLRHFPTTLGSEFNPSPSGNFEVTSVTREPWFHYQPELLNEGSGEDYRIPPGPNSPVGVVWIALSKPHYGIHGTSAPETIGYSVSHGCIRLTNWDARIVADQVSAGVPVEFIDVAGEEEVALR